MNTLTITPWSDSNEFQMVFDSIYQKGEIIDIDYPLLIFARNKLSIWLVRCRSDLDISANLMATKEIVNALIEDNKNSENDELSADETAIYSLYAQSVIRFCTAISQYSHEDNMKSVKRLANKYSCPQWIIDCRHNLCHSSVNEPTLEELRTASMIGLDWLKQYFWLKVIDNYNKRSKSKRNFSKLIDKYLKNENINNGNNNNENKTKTKTRNEIIKSLREFPNDFISVLIEHLISPINENNSEKTNSVNFDSLKIPKVYLKKYAKIFAIVTESNALPIVLNTFVRYFDCGDKCRRHLAVSWFSTLFKCIDSKAKISKFKRIFKYLTFKDIMPRIEWIRLLHRLVRRPNPNTPVLIHLIAPIVSDVIPLPKIEMLVNLAKEYSNKSLTDETGDDADNDYVPKTIEDLVSATDQMNGSVLDMSDTNDWSEVNFGASVGIRTTADADNHFGDQPMLI